MAAIVFLALLALASARSSPPFYQRLPFKGKTDCRVKYTDWSPCSEPCGPGGIQKRYGEIVEFAKYGGRACTDLEQVRNCIGNPECDRPGPVDCQVWFGEWSECSKNCGGGTRWRNGNVEVEAKYGGKPCPSLTQEENCNQQECDQPRKDCQVWFGEWSLCSASCNGGVQKRRGTIEQYPVNGGKPCPELMQAQPCNQFNCDVPNQNCEVKYAEWSQCSKPCGGGDKWRKGLVTQEQVGSGKPCPPLIQETTCNDHACTTAPINCKVQRSEWTTCSQPCGGGISRRFAQITQNPENGGAPCPKLFEERTCNEHLCDIPVIDCKVFFSPWSECSRPCGGGSRKSWGRIEQNPANGGTPCPDLEREESCNEHPCLKVQDCKLWFPEWSACSASCGGGSKTRRGLIEKPPLNGGKSCPPTVQQQSCNSFECDIPSEDCQVIFAAWSECSQPCGRGGSRWRSAITQGPTGAGKPCPPEEELMQEEACNTFECTPELPTDCTVTFTPWSKCSQPCGGGVERRWGKIDIAPANGGKPCPELEQERSCNENLCTVPAVDCLFRYSDFTSCSASCGGGVKRRYANIIQQPKNGGAPCPALQEEVPCNEDINCVPQVIDCEVEYTAWTPCSKLCGGGTRQRWGKQLNRPSPGGAPCGPLEQSEACNTKLCSPNFFYGGNRRYSRY